jgi:hypothetical protein
MSKCCGIVQARNTRVAERATETGLSNRTEKLYRIPVHLILPQKNTTTITLHASLFMFPPLLTIDVYTPAENEIAHTD